MRGNRRFAARGGRAAHFIRSAVIPVALLWAAAGALHATTVDTQPNPAKPEPANNQSYVRDGTWYRSIVNNKIVYAGRIVATDKQYVANLDNQTRWSYDVLMNVCHSGGFLNDMQAAKTKRWTFSAAAQWWQLSYTDNADVPNFVKTVDNFSRAWRDDTAVNAVGMKEHFLAAAQGKRGIAKDPFAPATKFPATATRKVALEEFPVYASPDTGAPFGNDLRDLGDNGSSRQFAILVAWSLPAQRHAVNILRMYELLRNGLGIPAGRIAVLYGNPKVAANLGPFGIAVGPNDPNGFGMAPVNGTNTRTDWLKALKGDFFTDNTPITANDKVWVYNSGHGGHEVVKPVPQKEKSSTGVGLNDSTGFEIPIADGFDVTAWEISNVTVTEDDNLDLLQLTFKDFLPSTGVFRINGTQSAGFVSDYLAADNEVVPLDPFYTGPGVSYQVFVDHDLLGLDNILTTVDVLGVTGLEADFMVAALFQGGDQEYLLINGIPEPATLLLLGTASGMLSWLRRRRMRA